ncbi:hypothetical protein [Desulfatirhabdium butyrativorans]|uniref:hypothetical protein n=1 Tax=Desulfatirhabdium butyrativorans TaxID=340467 RepID=UPI0003F5F654|nr:hypothetical protein [Desulfatirhabdium butyrativorans]
MITAKALYNHGRIRWIDPIPFDITNAELRITVIPLSSSKDGADIDPCTAETVAVYQQELLQKAIHRHQTVSTSWTERDPVSAGNQSDSEDESQVDTAFFLSALEDDETEDAVWEKYLQ